MPSEDAFFDEQIQAPQKVSLHEEQAPDFSNQILESSIRQEKLLERILSELERMNKRINLLESVSSGNKASTSSSVVRTESPPTSTYVASRGAFVLPPGSRPAIIPAPVLTSDKKIVVAEEEEQEAILRRRSEEQARLARIEAERADREAEEQRKRLAELQKLQDEKRMKEELEKKTRGLMSGLLTSAGGSLFEDDDLAEPNAAGGGKKTGGLFDDD